jgi:outer membrane protein OmpA-like peptidoglycan-associated protein
MIRTSVLVLVTIVGAGCANMTETQRGAAQGAGIGALGGAVLGGIADGRSGATRGAAIGGALGGAGGYIWSQRMEEQKRAMEQATQGTGVAVTQTADNQLKLDVPSDVSFAVNRADIQPNFRPVLDRFAQTLNQNPAATVRVLGHTDSTGSDAINEPLSVNRAASVRDYLAARGVSPQRVQIDGRGSREPLASNATDAGRAQNRRVEIFVGEAPVARAN